ncbi:MAG: helix-turn-helix transcriptional regulator [Clostridia bacterium]|nr:helix-turn-helix transcriptional regulator [Clostridia bacterium]
MERKEDEFVNWLKEMLEKHEISQSELAKEIGTDLTYICKIVNGRMPATAKMKYLIINFFKQNYGEDYSENPLEKVIPTTYGEWLSLETTKHNISSQELAEATGIKSKTIRDIWSNRIKSTVEKKTKILKYLKEVYGIDITKGEELLERTISSQNEKYSIWINNTMKELQVENVQIANYLGINKNNFSKIRTGRIVPPTEKAELIFRFFEERGIDTTKGREIFQGLYKGTIRYKVSK